jgi:hypothetical protein
MSKCQIEEKRLEKFLDRYVEEFRQEIGKIKNEDCKNLIKLLKKLNNIDSAKVGSKNVQWSFNNFLAETSELLKLKTNPEEKELRKIVSVSKVEIDEGEKLFSQDVKFSHDL